MKSQKETEFMDRASVKVALVGGIVLFAAELCSAQSKKIPVVVLHSRTDQVGLNIAFAFKEAIRSSQSFYLDESDSNKATINIYLTSIDHDPPGWIGYLSAIADVIVYDSSEVAGNGIYLSGGVQVPVPAASSAVNYLS